MKGNLGDEYIQSSVNEAFDRSLSLPPRSAVSSTRVVAIKFQFKFLKFNRLQNLKLKIKNLN